MYKTILCATDISPRSIHAIKSAFSLAEKFNAKLHILNSQINLNSPEERLMSRISVKKRMDENKDLAENVKSRISDILDDLNITTQYDFLLREGVAEKVIINVAAELNADLIVMGTNGADQMSDYFLGTTASNVIKSAKCPVLVIPTLK
ncbi:MAG: universal stress protein [Candidatus Marinimicrobia bacterium]|nr:universal stress protein [Candidatus Neomarinimicrobiota bacterium]